ncbi:MAG: hypothetical protein NHF93_00680 [Candidatus Shikimatogenerans bostrichidophilus]|nr:MAG: hypothetical protein NHF93_00680 [Candidatus Shikimatogenerans bostrichidophilus]
MIRIGINGINKIIIMIIYFSLKRKNIKIININYLNNINNLIKELNNDNIYKLYIIKYNNKTIIINNKYKIKITNKKDIKKLKWKKYKIKYIIETNNNSLLKKDLYKHIKAGAKKVILLNNIKHKDIPIFILGINHNLLKKKYKIISSPYYVFYCLIPILKIIHREFGIIKTFITNIEEEDIKINNNNNYKLINNIIPELKNKIKWINIYIPNNNRSINFIDLIIKIKKYTNYENIKNIIKYYSKNEFSGILGYFNKKKKINFLYDSRISILDIKNSFMLDNNLIKIISWYNYKISYTNKILDLIEYMEYNL